MEPAARLPAMTARRRFTRHFEARPDQVRRMAAGSAPAAESRTRFPSTVVASTASPRLLVPGITQRKIGSHVVKGAWAGMPIFCLTLEERATCPATCHHWLTCYGNNMHWSRRHQHGPELEYLLGQELRAKQAEHPAGFVVRLHILGDFYDAAYAALWGRWLEQFPALHVFGFTARSETSDEGLIIRALNHDHPTRFVIRFSGLAAREGLGMRAAVTLWHVPEGPTEGGAVVCPVQTGKTACCGTCGFCWAGTKPVAFIAHGATGPRRTATALDEAAEPDDAGHIPPAHQSALPTPQPPAPRAAQALQAATPASQPSGAAQPPADATAPPSDHHIITKPPIAMALRPIEIRAELENTAAIDHAHLTDEAAHAAANAWREAKGLPPYRLIPARPTTTTETYLRHRGAP